MTTNLGPGPIGEGALEIESVLKGLVPGEGDLLEGLHRVQHHFGFVPREAIPQIARHFRLAEARVYGAVTYYSEYRMTPPPETTISWCSGPACLVKGSERLRLVLENMLGCKIGENSADNRFGLHLGQCNGTCDNAPQVWVDGKVVGPLDGVNTVELVRKLRGDTT